MLYSVVAFFVIAAGSTIVVLSTIRYYKLLEYYKEESYQTLQASWTVNLVLFYIFILGFILGGLYVLFNEVTKSYVFIALIFLVISVYIYFTVKNQVNAGFMLKNKILEAIKTFVDIIDQKDFTSSGHSRQVYDIVGLFYEELDDYKKVLNKVKLLDAAILHDIGKINISVEIFKGKQQLTVEEWNIIKSHPQIGKEMLDKTFFSEISDWVKYHHERVDGNGYYGIMSEDIPLESKIISIADTYSALRSNRSYREHVGHDEAIEIIRNAAGKQFDRKLVEYFLKIGKDALEEVMLKE